MLKRVIWSGIKRVIGNVLLVFCSLVAVVILTEIVLRIISPFNFFNVNSATYKTDMVLHHTHIPNSSVIVKDVTGDDGFCVDVYYNSAGFRATKEYDIEKPADTLRIMMLGDSFVESRQVSEDQMFATKYEELVKDIYGKKLEVLSQGVSSWSPVIEWLYFSREGYKYSPDILFLFVNWADITDDSVRYGAVTKYDKDNIPIAVLPNKSYNYGKKDFFMEKSAFFALVHTKFQQLNMKIRTKREAENIVPKILGRKNLKHRHLAIFNEKLTDADNTAIGRTFSNIKRLNDFSKKHGTKMVLVLIPFPHQVGKDERLRTKQLYYGLPVDYEEKSTRMQQFYDDFCSENNILFLDLLPFLKNAKEKIQQKNIFFQHDGHFTPYGHDVVAESLYEFTKAKGLIKTNGAQH